MHEFFCHSFDFWTVQSRRADDHLCLCKHSFTTRRHLKPCAISAFFGNFSVERADELPVTLRQQTVCFIQDEKTNLKTVLVLQTRLGVTTCERSSLFSLTNASILPGVPTTTSTPFLSALTDSLAFMPPLGLISSQ